MKGTVTLEHTPEISRQRRAIPGRLAAAACALLIAVLTGATASAFRPEQAWMAFAVFGLCAAGPAYALGWIVFVSPVDAQVSRNARYNIESHWLAHAASRTLKDVFVVTGLLLFALSVADWQVSAVPALLAVLISACIDLAVRVAVMARR